MYSAAPNFSSDPSPTHSMASVGQKRPASEMAQSRPVIKLCNVENWDTLDLKEKTNAKGESMILLTYNNTMLFVDLAPARDAWLRIPFGFDRKSKFTNQKMEICGGEGENYEMLPCNLELTDDLLTSLRDMEARAAAELRTLKPNLVWHNSIIGKEGSPYYLATKVIVKGPDATILKIRTPDGATALGRGVSFLKPFLDEHRDLCFSECKPVVTATTVWMTETKAGINWRIRQMAVRADNRQLAWPELHPDSIFD